MTLTPEWRRRLDHWRRELSHHFYRPLGAVVLAGFVTAEQLTAEQALARAFTPMPPGTRWGGKWEYGWFQGEFVLPEAAAGQRIVLRVDAGGESLVFVNGRAVGAKDQEHTEITLATAGEPGVRYQVLVEAYAGHGPMVDTVGPVPPGRVAVPEPGPTQAVVGESSFGIWNEDAYQLWLDVETLRHVRDNADADSLRVAEIDAGLRDFTRLVDFELPFDEMMVTVRAGRERLQPLLACTNGSTAPTLFTCGHAHLDVAWLWPLAETERKIGRTVANQLALMAEYPEYRYLQSQPHLYTMLAARYPELYERAKAAAAAGQLIPEGGMWVEADTNITGGESLIRQLLYGKRFFREEFGVECELLWLPDVFGYSAALPQIMRGCGIRYFATQKISWTYNGGDPFPYNTFTWEGLDGSQVLAHLFYDYNSHTHPGALIQRWRERVQRDGIATMLLTFGHGDGGGGPTRDHLEYLRRTRDLEGVPRARLCSPVEFFRDQEARGVPDARYVGELYFQAHRGTYTSQARTKQNNRRSELALREAELWAAAAQALPGFAYPRQALEEAWRTVLLLQFHDILPGSSIQRVYAEAEASHAAVLEAAQAVAQTAAATLIAENGTSGRHVPTAISGGLTVFNSLSWGRRALVTLPEGAAGATDAAGRPLVVQRVQGCVLAEVAVPACGWTTVRLIPEPAWGEPTAAGVRAAERSLENELLRLTFNDLGEITSIFDKETGQELAVGPCNSFKMYRDVPAMFDAWDIDSMVADTPVALDAPATIEVVAQGPLLARLRVARRLHDSAMTQEITLRRDSRRVDFATAVDWQESHKLLKVAFLVAIHADEALHEIQFGHVRRPNHRSRPYDASRFEVSNHKWSALVEEGRGFAVLNDSKYGLNVLGNSINLTLLKAALAPDMTADKGVQRFTYAFYAWNGGLADSPVVQEAYDLNCPVMALPGAAGERSLFALDAANVVIEAVKLAEDNGGPTGMAGGRDIIVRLYEAKRMATRCVLSTTLPVVSAAQTDMLERDERELPCEAGRIPLEFRPFEIKTIRLRC
ncbi:MAG: alpha-mannosidase [Anaerolineae bacterium CG2_30_64_16]|nr:MAG: alpha-mannosidase [Anaerolineae bacterium CG2_30_64_16]